MKAGRQTQRNCVTIERQTILRSVRLFQQYLVNSYTCIEEVRLRWVRANQPQLRSELYKGLKDAVLQGDTTPASVGKRIVLPSSFTGGPRYMAQNFHNPDLFLTFTSNPKWLEIKNFIDLIPA